MIENDGLPKEIRLKARVVKLYVLCGEAGSELVDCVNKMVERIEPDIFCALKGVVEDIGEEMSPALETVRTRQR